MLCVVCVCGGEGGNKDFSTRRSKGKILCMCILLVLLFEWSVYLDSMSFLMVWRSQVQQEAGSDWAISFLATQWCSIQFVVRSILIKPTSIIIIINNWLQVKNKWSAWRLYHARYFRNSCKDVAPDLETTNDRKLLYGWNPFQEFGLWSLQTPGSQLIVTIR